MSKIFAALLASVFLIAGCGGEKTAEKPAPKTEQAATEQKFFSNGQFKVGTDLPAGEYIAIGTGYVEVATVPEGKATIVVNDNIVDAQRYVTAQSGEYVKLTGDIKLYPSSDAPKIKVDKNLPAGQFKCGTDIAAGEYKISLDAGGYFAVTRTTGNDYVQNQFTNEGGNFYVTVADGQFLQIKKGTGKFVGAGTLPPPPKVETPAEKPKPQVKRPEKSMMLASKNAIEQITKHYVTDSWILEYGEYVNPNGTISTHGACEIDSDGKKRLYWLTFDATGQKVLRLKIDSDLIYSVDGK
ncbi:MAG: hypothetical protein IKO74_02365 [Selenomonadaceae bacterium]|nr:hypothetical protein [Selenomonadaceae bacterium]MBR4641549.1 hypothetical protein [Selenomonadaceae bacterium]